MTRGSGTGAIRPPVSHRSTGLRGTHAQEASSAACRHSPIGRVGAGFPSAQVMQSAGRCYRPWAKQRLGHGHSAGEYPWWGWLLAYPPAGGSPAGGGPWTWRGVANRDHHCSAEGGTQIVRTPGRGRHNVPTPWRDPNQTPIALWFRRRSRGYARLSANWAFANQSCTIAHIEKQARAASALTCAFTGGGEGSRTPDTGIFSPLLYQLSYPAKGLLLQARLLYQTRRKGQRESLQCRENHRVEPR